MKLKKQIIVFIIFIVIFYGEIVFLQAEINYEQLTAKYEKQLSQNWFKFGIKRQLSILYHNWAHELTEKGLWEEAITKQTRAYQLQPQEAIIKNALAYYYNGYALELREKKYFQEAVINLKEAINYASEQSQIKKNLAVVYVDMANEEFHLAEYMRCENFLKEAELQDPENAYLYVLKGEVDYVQDNYYFAQENWEKALQINPHLSAVKLKLEKLKNEKNIEKNFNVQEVEHFRLKFEGLDNRKLADKAAAILRDAYREVGQDFSCFPQQVIPVIIYPKKELKKLDYFPDWAAGTYDGKIRIGEDLAIMGKNGLQMNSVLFHEYTHVIIRLLGGDNVPLWLNEGLAECQAQKFKNLEEKRARQILLKLALKNNTLFSLDQLGAMNLMKLLALSGKSIELVYAQSESFVSYLIERASYYDIRNLLGRLGEGENIYKAVKDVLFVELEVLEKNWKADVLQ
ncbi:MAG: hypothetical protein ABIG64_02940 [Candidatus Omnitrophota bacterium]